jgi:hypothetical protein
MHRVRSHLTYANVMVTILAFVVLGGGTALASYLITSNSQVGPGTISGHKPPIGDHANIIAGSVNGQDIANGSVGPGDLTPLQDWQPLAFTALAEWTAYGGSFNPPAYFKDRGVVHLRGLVKNPTPDALGAGCFYDSGSGAQSAGVMFVLPAGYRPPNEEIFAVDNSDGFGRIDVLPSGVVCSGTNTPSNGFASLDGITFRAAS